MPDLVPEAEQRMRELLALRKELTEAGDKQRHVAEAVSKELGRIAREHYPGLSDWEPSRLRQLGESIALYAKLFAGDLSKFSMSSQIDQLAEELSDHGRRPI